MIAKRKPDRIDEESVCIDSLVRYLQEIYGAEGVQAEKEENDPPDYWVTISGWKYGAEVTSIVTDEAYRDRCRKLAGEIQQISELNDWLSGNYGLSIVCHPLGRPDIPKPRLVSRQNLVSKATDYVRQTKGLTSVREIYLAGDDEDEEEEDIYGCITIQKLSNTGASVSLGGPVEMKSEGDAVTELSNLIQDAIDRKRVKLENKGTLTKCPVIILLYDAYGFCDPANASEAFQKVAGFEWTHSIFWVAWFTNRLNQQNPKMPGRQGTFLYTKQPDWVRA